MRGFLCALSGLIGILLIHQPFYSFLFLLLLGFLVMRTNQKHFILILCTVAIIFSLRTFFYEQRNVSNLTGDERLLIGKVADIPYIDGNYAAFQIKLSSNEVVQAAYRIKTEDEKQRFAQLQAGMTCSFAGQLEIPYHRKNPGSFDYSQFLKQKGIHWVFSIQKLQNCTNKPLNAFDRIKQYRQKGLEAIQERFPNHSAGIVQALLFGERGVIDKEVVEAYQTLGLIHVLVVSGLHVGAVLAFLYWIMLRAGLVREKVHAVLLLVLPVYVLLTGAAPSVMRAAIMAAAVMIGLLFRKKLHPLESISFAFLLITFIHPNELFHVGFQLSFVISFGLIASAAMVNKLFSHALARLLAVSIIAQLLSIPLIVYYFHHISILSFIVNAFFVPLFTAIVMPLSFFSFFASFVFPLLSKPLIFVHKAFVMFIHETLVRIDSLPFASITLGQISPLYAVLYFAAIVYLFIQIERQTKLTYTMVKSFIPFLVLLAVHYSHPYINPYGKVTMINVGQGDSILIELPFRKAVYLIDAGGAPFFGAQEDWQVRRNPFDVGKDIVIPVLKAEGIRKIDKLILTHGDEDHIGGAKAILEQVKVNELVYGKSKQFENNEKELLMAANEKKIKVSFVASGMSWRKGMHSFHILGPTGNEESKNDRSIILYTKLGGVAWLFMGDAEQNSEVNFVRRYSNIQAEVLKVGHHGSKTSTSEQLLQSVQPKVALISVGRGNSYGHPHEEVLSRLEAKGIRIFRTDIDGAIQFRFTDKKGRFLQK